MDRLIKGSEATLSGFYTITLPSPALTGAAAILTAEFNSRTHPVVSGVHHQNQVQVYLNGLGTPTASFAWWSIQNVKRQWGCGSGRSGGWSQFG